MECLNLTKSFGGVHAVEDVSAPFEAGKITALVGPNGAGKTTLFHLIGGAIQPDSGDVLYDGQRLNDLPPWEISGLGIGRLFQDVRVFERLSVLENLLVAFGNQVGEHPLAPVAARWRVSRQEAGLQEAALRYLELVDLANHRGNQAQALSYGQQKLLAIARLLAAGADSLLLDEPTAGVHPILIDRLLEVIRRIAGEGKTLVVIEHNMNVVLDIADWVYFMNEGQILAFGTPRDVLDDPEVRATYLGLASKSNSHAQGGPDLGTSGIQGVNKGGQQ